MAVALTPRLLLIVVPLLLALALQSPRSTHVSAFGHRGERTSRWWFHSLNASYTEQAVRLVRAFYLPAPF